MSLNSMLEIERERDAGEAPKKRVRRTTGEVEDEPKKTGDILINAVPTEVLAPYTAIVAGIVATIDAGESSRIGLRWALYGAGFLAILLYLGAAYRRRRKPRSRESRKFPVAGALTSLLAFGAWGLVMPGSPLSISLTGDTLTIWTVIISVGGTFLVGLATQPLKQPAK